MGLCGRLGVGLVPSMQYTHAGFVTYIHTHTYGLCPFHPFPPFLYAPLLSPHPFSLLKNRTQEIEPTIIFLIRHEVFLGLHSSPGEWLMCPKRHRHKIVEPVCVRVWSVMRGTSCHRVGEPVLLWHGMARQRAPPPPPPWTEPNEHT